ncbi:MAG: energy transducer TonB [Blastocatellia bacterium]
MRTVSKEIAILNSPKGPRIAWMLSVCSPSVMAVMLMVSAAAVGSAGVGYGQTSEQTARNKAIKTVMPIYPESSKRSGASGTSVTEFVINEQGGVENVKVLQAPDPDTKDALVAAVSQWKFQPFFNKGAALKVMTKLTFFFVIRDGRAEVLSPRFHKADP